MFKWNYCEQVSTVKLERFIELNPQGYGLGSGLFSIFINNLDEGVESPFVKVLANSKRH